MNCKAVETHLGQWLCRFAHRYGSKYFFRYTQAWDMYIKTTEPHASFLNSPTIPLSKNLEKKRGGQFSMEQSKWRRISQTSLVIHDLCDSKILVTGYLHFIKWKRLYWDAWISNIGGNHDCTMLLLALIWDAFPGFFVNCDRNTALDGFCHLYCSWKILHQF